MSSDPEILADAAASEGLTSAGSAAKLRLSRPHPLIRRTMDQKEQKDQWGNVRQSSWPGVDVRVSKGSRHNALIVMDRLFKALAMHDVEASVMEGGYGEKHGTFATSRRDRVPVYVTEEYKKVPHVATAKELRAAEGPYGSRIPKNDSVPTGKLTLTPGGVVDLSSEAALARLIAKATDEIVGLLTQERVNREAAEKRQRLEWDRQKQEQEEKARVEAFHKAVAALQKYREAMDYIEEVRRFGRVPDDQRKDGQSFDEWLKWAEWRARQIHPLG